jgi:hypothetical protein
MSRSCSTVLLLLVAGLPAGAQVAEPPALMKLKAEHQAATEAYSAAVRELTATDEYKKAMEARDREAMAKLRDSVQRVDAAAFGKRALEAAAAASGEDAMAILSWAATRLGDPRTAEEAAAWILRDHLKSPRLADFVEGAGALGRLLGADRSSEMLAAIVAGTDQPMAKAWALYWQAMSLSRNRDATEEQKAQATGLLAEAEALAGDSLLGDRIRAPRFEKERLQIGMAAPDIEGEDVDGVRFKLSDYLGKVVVLDFWGFW